MFLAVSCRMGLSWGVKVGGFSERDNVGERAELLSDWPLGCCVFEALPKGFSNGLWGEI